eukprot:TRINITY_DN1873_c0_g1_i1.p1 TRINITY_DN1873_c0_g1~~TRINITY_DN1873_c0_g1_i1.p1  ORF type:complete len:303 (+),score=59.03 TRINITY_DN1873_c0_g1_i1:323-1231(+)
MDPDCAAVVMRAITYLSSYDMEIAYRKGKDNQDADALSRLPTVNVITAERNARLEKTQIPTKFVIGNLVWYFREQKGPSKFKWNWLGPAKVIRKFNDQAYEIKDINTEKIMKINIRRLRRFEGDLKQIEENNVAYAPNAIIFGYPTNVVRNEDNADVELPNVEVDVELPNVEVDVELPNEEEDVNHENGENNFEDEEEVDNENNPEVSENEENGTSENEAQPEPVEKEWTTYTKKLMTDAIKGSTVQRGWVQKLDDLCTPRLRSYHKYRNMKTDLDQVRGSEAKKQLVLDFVAGLTGDDLRD